MGNTTFKIFLWGSFGGMLPTIAKLANTFSSNPTTPLPEIGLYVGLILWAIIGGGVALTNTNPETRQAIFSGIAAPAIIASFVAGGVPQKAGQDTASLLGIAAVAQEAAPLGALTNSGAILVSPTVTGGLPKSAAIPITAEVKDSSGVLKTINLGVISDLTAPSAFAVPAGTQQVFVSGKPVELSKDASGLTNLNVSVTTNPTISGDFLWALGWQRKFEIKNVAVSPATSTPNLDFLNGSTAFEPNPSPKP